MQPEFRNICGRMLSYTLSEESLKNVDPVQILFEICAVLAFFLFLIIWKWRHPTKSQALVKPRRDLLAALHLRKIVKSKYFPFILRGISAAIFVFVIATGLFGNPRTSLAASFTWLVWWTLLIFFIAFMGKVFCAACPWDFFADFFQFGFKRSARKEKMAMNLKWPKIFKNIYPATAFFIFITWLELGFDVTGNSYTTAILGLVIVGLAILCGLLFEKRSFCRFACPIGRISGVYAAFSPMELRVQDRQICNTCKNMECIRGTETTTGCPTFQLPYRMKQNAYCTLCTECIRSCPEDNLTIQSRPLGAGLDHGREIRRDEAMLTIVILVLTFFHGLTMTPAWINLTTQFSQLLTTPYIAAFSILMTILLLGGTAFFVIFDRLLRKSLGWTQYRFGLIHCFIPSILGYHLGHNIVHLISESPIIIPALSDPMGWGWDLFGWSNYQPKPLLSFQFSKYLQLAFAIIGFYYAVKFMRIRVDHICQTQQEKKTTYAAYCSVLFLLGVLSVWFMFQPMASRSGI